MKKIISFILATAMCLALGGCGHSHTWQAATCSTPKICPDCGETEGEALGHTWIDATCTESKFCSVCGLTSGEALGHTWLAATCEIPSTCEVCNKTDGLAAGHNWLPASCSSPEVCSVCNEIRGDALEHKIEQWEIIQDSTCTQVGTQSGVCTLCGETVQSEVALVPHTPGEWEIIAQPTPDEDGTRVKKCTVCFAELESEEFSLSDEEIEQLYKNECQSISYDSLSRTPGQYEGQKVKFSGYVVQVCSEAQSMFYYSTYRVATSGSYDDIVYIKVDNYGSGSRILEDDYVTFYGEFDGLYTYETVMGASITIPCIIVEYIE